MKYFLPRRMDISQSPYREEFLHSLALLRRTWPIKYEVVEIDISQSAEITLPGFALFVAELHFLLITQPVDLLIVPPASGFSGYVEVIRFIAGTMRYAGMNDVTVEVADGNRRLFLTSDVLVLGEKFSQRLDPYLDRLPAGAARHLYDAVVEAMGNALEHAYRENRFPSRARELQANRWWFVGMIDNAHASLALVDLGIGIPRAYRKEWIVAFPDVAQIDKAITKSHGFSSLSDPLVILHAWHSSVTSTLQRGRGRGFGQICGISQVGTGASVSVFSNKGLFKRTFEEGDVNTLLEFQLSSESTIIHWTVPFREEGHI